MSKINAVRFINLNYNNNAIRISDETFHMNGESTLLSLRNGGGKSVLVQMMMAPFVHKRYRDAKERPFESYFTTSKPAFILVEWALDHGAGYVMTGMMVRRRQEISTETSDNLEMIQFISEYRHSCPYDIHHLPVVEKRKKEMVLKNFSACRQLFDTYKKDSAVIFYSYDMNNSAQARQYFDKLAEYQIYYKEWETIMKKVNLKESGLSELFSDCKDEKGLVEKWLLDAVASKLNKEKDRMKEFQTILEKYVGQYKDNKSKIQRRDIIRQFSEEAKGVMDAAHGYEEIEQELHMQQGRIGAFLWQIETAGAGAQAKCADIETEKERLMADMDYLRCQQISQMVYEAMEAERYCRAEREMVQLERDEKEQECEQTKHMLHLLDCARQQQELEEQHAECAQYEQQLDVLNQKEQDFSKERNYLGYTLRMHYEEQRSKNEVLIQQQTELLEQLQAQIAAEDQKAETHRAAILELSTSVGSVKAKIQEYDEKEEQYNKRYEPGFVRNILGEYEPAALEIRLQEYEKEFESLKKAYMQMQKKAEEGVWQQKENERNLEDIRQKRRKKESELEQAKAVCSQYEKELQERRTILRYFGLDETVLYDMEKILNTAQHKLSEIEWAKRKLEKEEDMLQKEYQRITQGRVVELPEEFEKLLGEIGASYVFGMEWLKKNPYTEKENKKLVRSHPFLPYALIVSQRDLAKLKQLKESHMPYTPFPIPLMIREQLEQAEIENGSPVVEFADVSFYMLFNEHLLNEKKLKEMIADQEQQIAKKKEQIRLRREEYESYFEKKERLRAQTVIKDKEAQAAKKAGQTEAELAELSDKIRRQKEETDRLEVQLRALQRQIQDNVKQQSVKERRLEDLRILQQAYDAYLQHKEYFHTLQQELSVARDKERLAQSTAQKLRERAKSQEIELEHSQRKEEEFCDKVLRYQKYEKDAAFETDAEYKKKYTTVSDGNTGENAEETINVEAVDKETNDIEAMENRYLAITSQLSLRQQEIERLLQNARDKEQKIAKELTRRWKKYRLTEGEWKQTKYDAKAEEYQEQLLIARQQQYELKKVQWNEADKNAALAGQRLEQQRKLLLEKCGRTQPLQKEEIQPINFEAEIEKHGYKCKELEQEYQKEQKRIGWYEENLTALAEYAEYKPKDEKELWTILEYDVKAGRGNNGQEHQDMQQTETEEAGIADKLADAAIWKEALEQIAERQDFIEKLSGEELRRTKGVLVRDYNYCIERRQKQKDSLTRLLNQMVRREAFAEDFYRKPIEAMLTLTDHADQVIRQLRTTLQSYENLMEKIQVDIAVVEEEKNRIAELLGEYVHEVHLNLGRIDQNATITIREKSIKMLKITLPNWEENESLYQIRIQDFMDETTKRGIELLEQNENAQEYFGVRMTTKNLYDVVVGIENVQIRLYKVEEQREYPITWSQVARNSGGEGFLSAFIILTSLLYYMRKDDTDLFADRNEGKVLVMDNPFAQTNASHLLKPLMDMAKKTNTQLICLSGLGGESIYNRFDNIYVLNLVAANLRNGMQYLKAEHMRGEDTQTMVVSQIEVLGQQELVF